MCVILSTLSCSQFNSHITTFSTTEICYGRIGQAMGCFRKCNQISDSAMLLMPRELAANA